MLDLTFGEQVKLILSRKGMTIKELAEMIEKKTGKRMSRQNLTQRLGRDNFQEQDMRMIAEILECPFRLSILSEQEAAEQAQGAEGEKPQKPQQTTKELVKIAKAKARKEKKEKEAERLADAMERVPSEMRGEPAEKEMTLGDYIDIHEELVRQETSRMPRAAEEEEAWGKETDLAQSGRQLAQAGPGAAQIGAELARSASDAEEPGTGERHSLSGEDGGEEPYGEAAETHLPEGAPEDAHGEDVPEAERDEPRDEVDVEELLREMEELEKERRMLENSVREPRPWEEAQREEKASGWLAMFQRKNKKERPREETVAAEEAYGKEAAAAELHGEETDADIQIDYFEYDEWEDSSGEEIYYEEEEAAAEEMMEELLEEDEDAEDLSRGELNPYTGHEYETNSVRMHPKRIGYVQLYDRRDHAWTDMTEWAFLGYQERKRALLGKDYESPIYLD